MGAALAINISFTTSTSLPFNAALGVLYLACVTVIWILLCKNREAYAFNSTSFVDTLNQMQNCSALFKHYYLMMNIVAVIAGLLMSLLRNVGLVVLGILMASCITTIVVIVVCNIYKEGMDKFRAISNCVITAFLLGLAIIGDKLYESLGLGVPIAAANVTLLFVAAILNMLILIVVTIQNHKNIDKIKVRYTQENQMK